MNLSFAGCGFLGIYHVGVAGCFKKYAPHLLLDKISGASAGAIAACCLLCDLPLGELTSNVLRVSQQARRSTLGPFSPSFNIHNILIEGLQGALPEDAHLRVNGKLHISMTRVYDGKNVVVSQFDSKQDLMQALLASSFIPVFSGLLPPKFHGIRYMDGGFSNNLPMLDENTITVSPFCGESDICPRDLSSQLFHINYSNTSIELSRHNICRFARILFPPNPEILSNMCKQGFDDALRFLHRNNLINCTRCLAVQSTFVVSETLDESFEYDPECLECKHHRQEAMVGNLPETITSIFQDAIDSANKGLINWIFKHRGMKLLSVLSLPYTLPADIVYATFTKFVGTPKLGDNLWAASQYIMNNLIQLLTSVDSHTKDIRTNITCQLDITNYSNTKYDGDAMGDVSLSVKNKMNFNFTLNIDERQGPSETPHTTKPLSRRPSTVISRPNTPVENDTFDHILQVTAHNDAVMAYYYMDENNKVKVTEIFDVTDAESSLILSPDEQENNTQLEFEDGWNEPLTDSAWLSQQTLADPDDFYDEEPISLLDMTDDSEDDDYLDESRNIFSDPESEWNPEKMDEVVKCSEECSPPDFLPESDQQELHANEDPKSLSRKSSYLIMDV